MGLFIKFNLNSIHLRKGLKSKMNKFYGKTAMSIAVRWLKKFCWLEHTSWGLLSRFSWVYRYECSFFIFTTEKFVSRSCMCEPKIIKSFIQIFLLSFERHFSCGLNFNLNVGQNKKKNWEWPKTNQTVVVWYIGIRSVYWTFLWGYYWKL